MPFRDHRLVRADWYDFPHWYDILHTPGTAGEVDGLERIERRFCRVRERRLWLEPACGTGRYLRVAAGRGIRVVGFDRNARMMDYARATCARRGLPARFFIADMTRFRPPARASFAFCPINTIRHLLTDRAMLAHLACMRRALAPGGVYAVGLEACRYGRDRPTRDEWVALRGRTHVRQVVRYHPPRRQNRLEHVCSTLVVTGPMGVRRIVSEYDLRAYSARQWFALLRRARWSVLGVCHADGRDAPLGPGGRIPGGYAVYVLSPE